MAKQTGDKKNTGGSRNRNTTKNPRSKARAGSSDFNDAMAAIDIEADIAAIAGAAEAGEKIVMANKPSTATKQKEEKPAATPETQATAGKTESTTEVKSEVKEEKSEVVVEKKPEVVVEEKEEAVDKNEEPAVIKAPTSEKKEEPQQPVKKVKRGPKKKENALEFKHQYRLTTGHNNLLFMLSNAPEFEEFKSNTEILHYIIEEFKKKKNIKEILERGLSF